MYTAFIVFGILGYAFFAISFLIDEENKDATIATMVISCLCFSICLMCFMFDNKPTAMDVYRGKTTLEITYKDGIPIDSVVVFKTEKK